MKSTITILYRNICTATARDLHAIFIVMKQGMATGSMFWRS